jgi:methyl-accepting chemotaxis protein
MKQFTIGKRITLGFSTVIAITLAVGAFAIVAMWQSLKGANIMAQDYVPEVDIASRISAAMAEVRVNGRSYQFTGEKTYLEAGRKALDDVKKGVQDAEALANKSAVLVKLKEQVKDAPKLIADYETLLGETEKADLRRDKIQADALAAATAATKELDDLITDQGAKLKQEIADKKDPAALAERQTKLMEFNRVVDVLNAARIANFKSQAQRDAKILAAAVESFAQADQIMVAVQPLVKTAEGIRDFTDGRAALKAYGEALQAQIAVAAEVDAISTRRGAAAKAVETFAVTLQEAAEKGAASVAASSASGLKTASTATVLGVSAAVVIGLVIAFLIVRSIGKVLREISETLAAGADQTASAAAQISSSSQSLAEGASEQAASLEETSASLEEITSMVKRNAEAAAKAKEVAGQTRTAADVGTNDMVEMEAAMNDIRTSSAEVAKIVKDIDEIAFQTNILALNAAVEAARAGEAGMGFAVVADEVRNLAQRSAKSAKETALKIEDAISKSERGVQISGRVAASFTQIAGKTREVDQFVAEIALASSEQAQGIQQVSVAVSQMDKVTQSNAATAEEAASASEELNSQAVSVSQTVAELERLVGGAKAAPAAESHAHAVHAPAKPAARSNLKSPAPAKAHKSSHVKAGEVHRLSPSVATASNGHAPRTASLPLPGEHNFAEF